MSTASTISTSDNSSSSDATDSSPPISNNGIGKNNVSYDRRRRLIDWNVDLFAGSIRNIVARRGTSSSSSSSGSGSSRSFSRKTKKNKTTGENSTVLDEVVEIIELPSYDPKASFSHEDPQL